MKVLYFHQHFMSTAAGGMRSYEFTRYLIAKGHSICMVSVAQRNWTISVIANFM